MSTDLLVPFEVFAKLAKPWRGAFIAISFINPKTTHRIGLNGSVAGIVPERVRRQDFEEDYLQPLANELEIGFAMTAELMALRNAWIAYFQQCVTSVPVNEIRSRIPNEIMIDYVLLTSAMWPEHPWIQSRIKQPDLEPKYNNSYLDDPGFQEQHRARIEKMESDITHWITEFNRRRGSYSKENLLLDIDADFAEHDIKRAKKKIVELNAEIEEQEAIIRLAMRPIRKFIKAERISKKRAPGRPKETGEQREQSDIAKKFVARWITALMAVLSVTSCGELADMAGGQKMTWWRWLNKKTLPSARFLGSLLDVQIKSGEYKGKKLRDIQTTPALCDLIDLIDLV